MLKKIKLKLFNISPCNFLFLISTLFMNMIQNHKISTKKISKKNLDVFICEKIDFTELEIPLFENELIHLQNLKSHTRKIEFLGVRHLRNLFKKDLELFYSELGKPYTAIPNQYISISHSKNFIGLALSSYPVGIDIEECSDRVLKVANKFLNSSEKTLINVDSIEEVTSAWCIKECLFKLNDRNRIDFKEELIIQSIDFLQAKAKMLGIDQWDNVTLGIEKFGDLILCYNFE